MSEIYTKPFKSVQAAITLFEQKIDPNKCSTSNTKEQKGDVFKDVADSNLLLDASSKSPQELFALLKLCKAERDNYREKFRNSLALFLEYEKGQHLFNSFRNLEADDDDESRTSIAQKKDEMTNTEPTTEELNSMELLKHSSEIKKIIFSSKLSKTDAKNLSSVFCSVMNEDLKSEVFQSQLQLQDLRMRLEEAEDLENELLKQMIISEYFYMELTQSREAQDLTSKAILSAMNELYLSKTEIEPTEDGRQFKEHLNVPSKKMNGMNYQIELLLNEIHRMQEELSNNKKINPFKSQPIAAANESELSQPSSNQVIRPLASGTETFKNSSSACDDPDNFCSGITISMEEYEFLIEKSEMSNPMKSGCEINELKRELEYQNAEISELRCLLEETERRAEVAEKAKLEVESQLRKWRDQRRQRRAASDAVKEYCSAAAEKEGGQRQREKPLFSKLGCINPEFDHSFNSHSKRSFSVNGGKSSRHIPLGKLLKLKI